MKTLTDGTFTREVQANLQAADQHASSPFLLHVPWSCGNENDPRGEIWRKKIQKHLRTTI